MVVSLVTKLVKVAVMTLQQALVPRADQTLAALLDDLHRRGLLDETLVVWMGDFGRTPKISQPWESRDHWPYAFSILLAGAGLPGGQVVGRTDRLAAEILEDPITPADLTATIFAALGVDPRTPLPDFDGRSFPISEGRVLERLWG